MSHAVKEMTPVEMAMNEVKSLLELEDITPSEDGKIESGLNQILDYSLKYESDNRNKIFLNFTDRNAELIEENMLLKTQLRVLTKYIEGLERGSV